MTSHRYILLSPGPSSPPTEQLQQLSSKPIPIHKQKCHSSQLLLRPLLKRDDCTVLPGPLLPLPGQCLLPSASHLYSLFSIRQFTAQRLPLIPANVPSHSEPESLEWLLMLPRLALSPLLPYFLCSPCQLPCRVLGTRYL